MIEIGRLCVKIAGRDARKMCVIVDVLEDGMVLIDGQTRRRKCNVRHLEPLEQTIEIEKGADHSIIAEKLSALDITIVNKKSKTPAERPKKVRKVKEKPAKEKKKAPKKADKKTAKPKEDKKAKKTEAKEEKPEAKE